MSMKHIALSYLEKNKIKHIGMLECIKYDDVKFVYCESDGVFIYDKTANLYMIATDNLEVCTQALAREETVHLIVCHNDYEYEQAKIKFDLYGCNKCHQVVWTSSKIPVMSGICSVKKLDITNENVDFIFKNYTLGFSRERIEYTLREIGVYGAYYNGKLVGFIGRHEERSLGLLEVLPEYRRLGIGSELEKYMIIKLLKDGETPYGHIIYGNEKSITMHKKFGYTFSETPVYWLFKKK